MLDMLNEEELGFLREDVRDLFADQQISGSVIYQSFVGRGSFNPTTGGITQTFAGTWVNSYRRTITEEELKFSAGQYQVGDYIYYITVEDVITPKKDDRIIDGSSTRFVFEFSVDSVRVFNCIVARKL